MDPMPPPEPVVPSLPPRSTPIPQPGGFPGWGAAPMPPPGPPAAPTRGGPQFPYGMPLPPMARTYGLATAALVCGLLGLVTFWLLGIVPLLGLIFGLISARAIKRSGGTLSGLGKARAGWIMGLIGVVGASAFFWAGVTGRLDKETETTTDADNNPATSPYIEAEVGDCVGSIPEEDVVYELEFVSCGIAHSAEVYLIGKLNPDGTRDYPGDAALLDEVEQKCDEGFQPYVGRTYELSVYEIFYLYPRAFGWKPEQGAFFCFLGEVGKTNFGSAFHSDR
ncbi:MAG: DUF4190 domain-containing protein [Actinomycetia bacterium]|nr:DUF4190 domain-containing protein [Actinomycetes bacterium]